MDSIPELTPLPQASRLLGVPYWQLYRRVALSGEIPAVNSAGRWWLTPANMAAAAEALGVPWPPAASAQAA